MEHRVSTGGWTDDYTTLHWFDCPWCGFVIDYGSEGYTFGDEIECPDCDKKCAVEMAIVARKVEGR